MITKKKQKNKIRGEGGNVENKRVQMEESDNHTEHYKRQDKAKYR